MACLTVIKLGGSHAFDPHLQQWLRRLAARGEETVVVPGGGPFADVVRHAQSHLGFDDSVAHHLALMAMEQYGRILCALQPQLILATSIEAVRNSLTKGRIPVWGPVPMALAAAELPASWQLSSDSLAAWFAGHIGAQCLILVKHLQISASAMAAVDLAACGIVDGLFPQFFRNSGVKGWLVGLDEAAPPIAIAGGEGSKVSVSG
jgi:dihydroneopterin aldolase